MAALEIYKIDSGSEAPIPQVGEIPAGFPSPATDYVGDVVDLNDILITSPGNTYYARIKDYYLIEGDLEKGDALLFDTTLRPRKGDLAVCMIDGEAQLKYIDRRNGSYCLVSGSSSHEETIDSDSQSYVFGVVTSIFRLRRYKGRRPKTDSAIKHKFIQESSKSALRWGYQPESEDDGFATVNLMQELISNPVFTVFGKAVGTSLIDDTISDGDSVIIDRILEPHEGDLAVSYTSDGYTLKYVVVRGDGVWLMPGNKNFKPIHVTEENQRLVWGVVVWSIKQLRFPGRKK